MMTVSALSSCLRRMYDSAPEGEQIAMIHLFGIRYANEIKNEGCSPKDIILAAQMKPSLATELNKGIKLAAYVVEKADN